MGAVATLAETVVDPRTIDADGYANFTLTSKGVSGPQWARHFKGRGLLANDQMVYELLCRATDPTEGVIYRVVLCRLGDIAPNNLFHNLGTAEVAARVKRWLVPHWEVACLIRDAFSNEQLGLMGFRQLIVMHDRKSYDDHKWGYLTLGGDPDFQLKVFWFGSTAFISTETDFAFLAK